MPLPSVRVLLTPAAEPVPEHATAVIVDVLRATTTLTHALTNGATRVIPVATIEAAHAAHREHPTALLCGEREGRIIPGFDLGNSPAEYGCEVVSGRPLIFASTNGSIGMLNAGRAKHRVLGAFVNATAVERRVAGERHVVIVCSGKLGRFSLEDASFAGWLCRALAKRGASIDGPAARFTMRTAPADADGVRRVVEGASHGRYLIALGGEFRRDVARCAEIDVIDRAWDV